MSSEHHSKIPLHAGAEPHQFKHARKLRKEGTPSEEFLWHYLRNRRFKNLKFRRQHPILDFIADFYCHELKLIIEIDGSYHQEENQKLYDNERTKMLSEFSYNVIRFTNDEVENQLEECLEKLAELADLLGR